MIKKLLLTLLFCSLTTLGFATDNPNLRVFPENGLMQFKGLDDTSTPPIVMDGRASDIQNIELSIAYSAKKRNGISLFNPPIVTGNNTNILDVAGRDFGAVTSGYYTKLSNGTAYTIATCDNRFYYDSAGTWTVGNYNMFSYGATGRNNQFVWATALDNIIGTNDTEPPIKWTGSGGASNLAFTGLTSPITKAKVVVWYKNYLIFGNTVENSVERTTRFRWSNVGTINTWSDDNYIDIAALGGQEIEGFGILYDNLYVFLTNSIYKISLVGGDEIFNVSKVIEDVGCIAKNSIQNVNLLNQQEGLMFLDKRGKVYFFNGTTASEMSTFIRTTMDGLNDSRFPYAVSATDGKNYYLSVSNGTATSNDLLLDFQTEIGEWTKYTEIDANAMWFGYDSNDVPQIYYGNYKNFVYQLSNPNNKNDIGGATGIFDVTNLYTTGTASGLTVLYDNQATFTTTGLVGAKVRITSGTSVNEEDVIAYNTSTGIVVTSTNITSGINASYTIGDIDAYYTTKWYMFGEPARRKQLQKMYLWTKSGSSNDVAISTANDYSSEINVDTADIATSGSLWGTAIWGTSTWGGTTTLMKSIELENSGRYFKFRFREPDINDDMELYGYLVCYVPLDIF